MNLPIYYVVRSFSDTRHRGSSHKIEAGPFFEHWRAREWITLNPVSKAVGDDLTVWHQDIDLTQPPA